MRKLYMHIVVWSLYLISLFLMLNVVIDIKTALIRTSSLAIIQFFVFYLNLKWILPKFYENKYYIKTVIINLIIIIAAVSFNLLTENYTPHDLSHSHIEGQHIDFEILFINIVPVVLTFLISFILYDFQKQKKQQKREFEILSAEKQFLIQQINPHFLFNTLNSIYYLTYNSSPKGAKAVMQLSKMLDYSLYGEKEGSVSLKDEVEYIKNFISLFKLKDSMVNNIKFDCSKAILSLKIAPMLLLPFIENAFKHGNIESSKDGFIVINLKSQRNGVVYFECKNSFEANKVKDSTKGIGIKNVTRRLDLLYLNNYELIINNTSFEYCVSLKIKTNA